MTNDDLKQIDQLLTKRFKTQDKRFDAVDDRFIVLEKHFDEKLSNNKDEIIQLLDKKLSANKEEVIDEMITFMEENLFPKFERIAEKSDIDRVERRIDLIADKVGEHEVRIKDIEAIPVIAHELKVKKKK